MRREPRIFVIGGGGREHAIVWHLARTLPHVSIHCAPGNPGIARMATSHPIPPGALGTLADAAQALEVDLTIVGPEAPLVAGIADLFESRGLRIIGPTAAAARVEGSKVFAKQLLARHGIPTAEFRVFDAPAQALAYVREANRPLVVKADGLAAGKGVIVCGDAGEAERAVILIMMERTFGDAGRRIVIEDRLDGPEVSVFALVDGEATCLLPPAQDHKRAYDGDRGPNTGGMGAIAPYPLTARELARIRREIIDRVAHALCAEGAPFCGILFAGIMLTPDGPKVLEFNCRLGDPEAQVVLPLLPVSLPDAFDALRRDRTSPDEFTRVDGPAAGAAAGVVLASRGYPEQPETGHAIDGLEDAGQQALVFHGGTADREGVIATAGGRVLTVVGRGSDLGMARARAYEAAARVHFEGMHYRRDIGEKAAGLAAVGAGGD